MENHVICGMCEFHIACSCTKDGVNIFIHAGSTGCPIDKFPKPAPKPRGLGDTVANVIQAVTFGLVKPCGGCKERQEALNRLMPYKS